MSAQEPSPDECLKFIIILCTCTYLMRMMDKAANSNDDVSGGIPENGLGNVQMGKFCSLLVSDDPKHMVLDHRLC